MFDSCSLFHPFYTVAHCCCSFVLDCRFEFMFKAIELIGCVWHLWIVRRWSSFLFKSDSGGPNGWRFIGESNLIVAVKLMASADVIKRDFLWKRAQMKSRITKENYKQRWFELTSEFLRYLDGSREASPVINSLIHMHSRYNV